MPIAGMVFSLLVVLVIAGSVLLFPLTRRLGQLLELRLEERRGGVEADALAEVQAAVASLEGEVTRLRERQEFVERLLEGSAAPDRLTRGSGRGGEGGGSL